MENDEKKRLRDMIENVMFAMFATHDGQHIHARPMAAQLDRDNDTLYFLSDVDHDLIGEIENNTDVTLIFSDVKKHSYVSLIGKAQVSNNRQKIGELWNPGAKAFWDSPEDPRIRVVHVVPEQAEYWDGNGTLGSMFKMAWSAMTDTRPDMGTSGHVEF